MEFSLDPPDKNQRFHPFQKVRYGPEKLDESAFLHTMFETDYLMKSFSVGTEISANPPFNQRSCEYGLLKNLPAYLKEAIKPVAKRGRYRNDSHRFWIQAENLVFEQSQINSKIEVHLSKLEMKIRTHRLLPGPDGKIVDADSDGDDPNSPEAQFAADMTSYYDELSIYFPMFARLRQLAKLQFLGIMLRSVLKNLQNKAEGKVPTHVLQDIQSKIRQEQKTWVNNMLQKLKQDIGVWPTAEDNDTISSAVERFKQQLPYLVRSSIDSEGEAILNSKVKEALRANDGKVLSQVVDCLLELGKQSLSRSNLEHHVSQWMYETCSSSPRIVLQPSKQDELADFICCALSLPSKDDIQRDIVSFHKKCFSAFSRKLNSLQLHSHNINLSKCNWVPAAFLKEKNEDRVSLCYGGVLFAPEIKEGRVPFHPNNKCKVKISDSRSCRSKPCQANITKYKAKGHEQSTKQTSSNEHLFRQMLNDGAQSKDCNWSNKITEFFPADLNILIITPPNVRGGIQSICGAVNHTADNSVCQQLMAVILCSSAASFLKIKGGSGNKHTQNFSKGKEGKGSGGTGKDGTRVGDGNGGGGGGSGNDVVKREEMWKKIQDNAVFEAKIDQSQHVKLFQVNDKYLHSDGKGEMLWVARIHGSEDDMKRHAGTAFKVWDDKCSFKGSYDADFKPIVGKSESYKESKEKIQLVHKRPCKKKT